MNEPIAIVGMACRLPGAANNPSKLWDLIQEARDAVREFPPERLNFSNFYSKDGEFHGRTDVHERAYLLQEDIRLFDAAFFRINPKEAAGMDPQHRLVLETVYEAFEAAGLPIHDVEGSQTSVHVGVMTNDYHTIQARDPDTLDSHAATGLSNSILSNRVSYAFDLKGPSMTIDTACSSSLVALHLAVQGLRSGESTQAVVAGVNLLLDPHWFITESALHMLSPDSRSRMWDKDANGYARGEGCTAVVLKPLSKAIQDGDHIECIIRETGVNSDGATNGITMPSSESQATLIRQTYQKAGLDPLKDRCQYFECHGTGTQAGDPVEARAIRDAFFPEGVELENGSPLYCGSIKTIVGHTEGCAGLAGILKASLAIQHGIVPPNMHFSELNPTVEPFYTNLCVPTIVTPWPDTGGLPRRASVNSFGFGGTNAHAIIESFDSVTHTGYKSPDAVSSSTVGPFVVSAKSRSSLVNSLKGLLEYLHSHPSLCLNTLSQVLQSKRSHFSHRVAIPDARDYDSLVEKVEEQLSAAANMPADATFGVRMLNGSDGQPHPGILGIFTGQGAQAAQMGKELLENCQLFRSSISHCEDVLQSLPEAPAWSLQDELMKPKEESRMSDAMISQPLCTAIQIALVDLLYASGIRFQTVVGHSSGEIGAAYAAGILSLRDAIGIAYYRGLVAHSAKGSDGQKGGMMAASMSLSEATAHCSESQFIGRIRVAASNGPSSVTLSGDIDAIQELKTHLNEKQIQARELKVDTAYHSHHMLQCSEQYLGYLRQLDIQVQKPAENTCSWVSSVHKSTDMLQIDPKDLGVDGSYWVDNMVQPVLFSEAVEYAIKNEPTPHGVALEIGPHPALKGPVNQTLKSLNIDSLPYAGCLNRGLGGVESMSAAVGLAWSYLGNSAVNFARWREAFGVTADGSMIKDLPSYPWDHEQIHWRESRVSQNYRLGSNPPHSLLGRMRDDLPFEKTWRNMLKLSEMPWVRGHTFQGQVLFPAAGYISLATEAAKLFVIGRQLRLLEITDVEIPKALIIGEDQAVELLFTIRSKITPVSVPDGSILETEFVATSCPDERNLITTCTGRILIHIGLPELNYLPETPISQAELTPLNTERFHRAVSNIGLGYTGPFRALTSINRSWGHAKATASWANKDLQIGCALPPALIDVAFQVGLATFVSTAERAMGSPHLPVAIKRVIIDPSQHTEVELGTTTIDVEALMGESSMSAVEVDINVCIKGDEAGGSFQVDGLILKAIAEPEPSADRNLFVKTVWDVDTTYGMEPPSVRDLSQRVPTEMSEMYERISLYYMQNLIREVSPKELESAKWHHRELARYIETTVAAIQEGAWPGVNTAWLEDNEETISNIQKHFPRDIDVAMLTAVGKNLPSVIRGQSEIMEHMLQDDLLGRLYKDSLSLQVCNEYVAQTVRQISHKHPRMKILEIGAGTGGTTLSILDSLDNAYSSYVCTDISASFFSGLADKLPLKHKPKVEFKTLNIEAPASDQGFVQGTYDIVVAANVLHVTRKLSETIKNARALLRPGGYLIAIEVTGKMLRETGLMGALEGWWLGVTEGRRNGPGISAREWDDLLQVNGFSGIECIAYDHPDASRHSCSVFAAQAIDDRFDILRDPLGSTDLIPQSPVLIMGGKTLRVSKLAQQAKKMLRRWSSEISTCDSIEALDVTSILPGTFVIYLADLDTPFFLEPLTTQRLEDLQEMLGAAKNILWVTRGRLLDDPRSNMMVGVGRALYVELPHVNIHYMDFDQFASLDADTVVCQALRMAFTMSDDKHLQDLLWAQEPEVVIRDGKVMIPRIVQDHSANEALNASRRQIRKEIGPNERVKNIQADGAPVTLSKASDVEAAFGQMAIDVEMSVALHVGKEAPCFVLFGRLQTSGASVFALSEVDASTVALDEIKIFQPPASETCNTTAATLLGVASSLLASCALSRSTGRGMTLVLGASDLIATGISNVAAKKGVKVLFINPTTSEKIERRGWLNIHPHASARSVKSSIPHESSTLLSFSQNILEVIQAALPKRCAVRIFDPVAIDERSGSDALEEAYLSYNASIQSFEDEKNLLNAQVLGIQEASKMSLKPRPRLSLVLDWRREGPVDAIVPPLQAHKLFSPKKTYFLAGMATELGQSLCRFMVRGGARYIVLGSRNPAKDPHWIESLRVTGADIRIVKVDVTDLQQLQETVTLLRKTMPQIAGVANAALVFEAGIFANFSAENVARQLKPKVDGTLNMDEVFKNDNLDFFLTFGSLATVCGNPGQAMYHAGNLFMASLVEQRRRRGQAASILNFGLLVDVGYVARTDRDDGSDIEGTLRSLLLTPLSESEFHQVVLRGIIAGRPGSQSGEIIMGMEPYIDDGKVKARPPWVDKAFFSHMIHAPALSEGAKPVAMGSTSMEHLREELYSINGLSEIAEVVRKMFYKKIELMIMVPESSIDLASPMVDLGLDSLHAIEIRNWLLKEINVEFPLLRILGREPLSAICISIAELFINAMVGKNDNAGVAVQPSLSLEPDMMQVSSSGESQSISSQFCSSGSNSPILSENEPTSLDGESDTGPSISVHRTHVDIKLSELDTNQPLLRYSRTEHLSYAQAGIHFLHTLLDDPTNFNVTIQYTIRGPLNQKRLARAIEKVLGHHEIYRTGFSVVSGSPEVKQHLASNAELDRLLHIESSKSEAEQDISLAFEKVSRSSYHLAAAESFRAVLISHDQDWHTAVFGFHLISSDALSFSIFLRDIDIAYQMLPLSPNPGSFLTFAKDQRDLVTTGQLESAIQYWKGELSPLPAEIPLLPFAHGKTRQPRLLYGNHVATRNLGAELVTKVKSFSQECGATPMQFYSAVMQVLLANLTQSDDICIGVTDNGRGQSDRYADAVGHFANILPMRFHTPGDITFGDLLNRTSHKVLSAFDNAQVPFDVLLESLGIGRSSSTTPLFQVAFNYRVGDILTRPLGNCTMTIERNEDVKTPYDLTINVTQTASKSHLVECITADSLYSSHETKMILNIFENLVESIVQDKNVYVRDCKMFSPVQIENSIELGRGPIVSHEWPETLPQRFNEVVSLFSDSVAIKDSNESLTYDALSCRVGLYISTLRGMNLGSGSRIAVLCEPGVDMYAIMLANLFIAAVHIPLDITLPVSRLQTMISACTPDVIVFHDGTNQATEDCSGEFENATLNLSEIHRTSGIQDARAPVHGLSSDGSFILFTSGSTGTPKGIRLGQRGIMNYAASKSSFLRLGQVKVLQQTSTGFDMAIAQAINAFANGGALVIAPLKSRGDPTMISQIILDEDIQFTLATPSEYLMLANFAADTLRKCTSWRHACSGGEAITEGLVHNLRRLDLPNLTLTDCYGPTEISCATTFQNIPFDCEIPNSIGKPLANTAIYILSELHDTALPVGIPGEICVGGIGVAQGYLDPSLNERKFVENPFVTQQDLSKGCITMYRTGDRGVIQPDGSLRFLGRTDGGGMIIKLRGLRIDLAEVAGAILKASHDGFLADAAVIVSGDPQYLVCFVVPANGQVPEQTVLNDIHRRVELPRYMIPSVIVPLERLPSTPNGKVDRSALQKIALPSLSETSDVQEKAVSVPEGELRAIWMDILGEAAGSVAISPDSDFFMVGGSSLLLVHLQNAIRERIGVSFTLQELYQSTTLRGMAAAMHQERGHLTDAVIDWQTEISIPSWTHEAAKQSPTSAVSTQQRQVLLSGSTTFLGSEILRQLIQNKDVSKIHCISVSDDERKDIPTEDEGKIIVYAGSVLSPSLGLTRSEITFLQLNVDEIIHATVQGHCMNNYSTVKQALYVSTQSLVGLVAMPRRIPFRLISAPRIILLSGKTEGLPVSMRNHQPPANGSQGVTASKWASECFLENANRELGLPVSIHRHCALIGARAPANDVMNSVVLYSLLTRKVPTIPEAEGFFDFKDVVQVASEIAAHIPTMSGPVQFHHHSSNVRVPFDQFAKRLQEMHGGEFEAVDPSQWLEASAKVGMPELLVIHLKANMESGQPMLLPYLGTE